MEVRLRLSLLKVEQTDPIKASVDLLYSAPVLRGLNVCWRLTGRKKIIIINSGVWKYKYYSRSCLQVEGEGEGNNPLKGRRVYLTPYIGLQSLSIISHPSCSFIFMVTMSSLVKRRLFCPVSHCYVTLIQNIFNKIPQKIKTLMV